VFDYDSFYLIQLVAPKTIVPRKPGWVQPEFRLSIGCSNVNVRWLLRFITEEKEAKTSYA